MNTISRPGRRPTLWIDLDNTPHVPFFEPIIEELRRRGCTVVLTARDAFQVCELADARGMRYARVGTHHGRNKLAKGLGLLLRAAQLMPFARREKPDLAISHGSRAQFIACNLLRIPSLLIDDYEHSQYPPLMRPGHALVPEVIPAGALSFARSGVRKYPGLKEDVYAGRLQPDPAILRELGIGPGQIVMTARPPATEAHYHDRESEELLVHLMDRACARPDVRVVLLPRNRRQGDILRLNHARWFADGRTVIPEKAVNALNLIWHSDLVVSGGGTMCREAAALGVPVFSVFRGPLGAVDQSLEREGRLVLLRSREDVDRKVPFASRARSQQAHHVRPAALSGVIDGIGAVLGEISGGSSFPFHGTVNSIAVA